MGRERDQFDEVVIPGRSGVRRDGDLPRSQLIAIGVLRFTAVVLMIPVAIGMALYFLGWMQIGLSLSGGHLATERDALLVGVGTLGGGCLFLYGLARALSFMGTAIRGAHVATDPGMILRRLIQRWALELVQFVLALVLLGAGSLIPSVIAVGVSHGVAAGGAMFLLSLLTLVTGVWLIRKVARRSRSLARLRIEPAHLPTGVPSMAGADCHEDERRA